MRIYRLSLKTVLRDSAVMLFGAILGLLLAQSFMSSDTVTLNGCRSSNAVVHIAKRGMTNSRDRAATHTKSSKGRSNPRANKTQESKRPKTVAEELQVSYRKTLFVGVVSSQHLLPTRAVAVSKTWGTKAPKLEFFSSGSSSGYTYGLPVIALPGVDDSYPPQKKVYRMLKYMHDHYINEYNWFMRADDDVYVRVEHLIHFLSKLDPNKELYIGQPGGGRDVDLKRIKLNPHEHYCMGGPGVIFSRALLIKLAPHLEDCLQNEVVSWNEDLEVGRCISKRLGVQCTSNYEVRCFGCYSELLNRTDIITF